MSGSAAIVDASLRQEVGGKQPLRSPVIEASGTSDAWLVGQPRRLDPPRPVWGLAPFRPGPVPLHAERGPSPASEGPEGRQSPGLRAPVSLDDSRVPVALYAATGATRRTVINNARLPQPQPGLCVFAFSLFPSSFILQHPTNPGGHRPERLRRGRLRRCFSRPWASS
jgi:hypothetical protein